jgi:hypothetical protein
MQETSCRTPPHRLFLPKTEQGAGTNNVGGLLDYSAHASGSISKATGSIDIVAGSVSSVYSAFGTCGNTVNISGSYTLLLNTNPFSTAECNNSEFPEYAKNCKGWE